MSKRVYTPVIDSVVARFSDGIRYPNIEADGELVRNHLFPLVDRLGTGTAR